MFAGQAVRFRLLYLSNKVAVMLHNYVHILKSWALLVIINFRLISIKHYI